METLKQQIQLLDLRERIALLAWLAQDVQVATEDRSEEAPPQWMFDATERAYAQFVSAGEEAIPWEKLRKR